MSTWQRYFGWLVTEIDRQPLVPPADIVPGFQLPAALPENAEAEYAARIDDALRVVHGVLEEERAKPKGFRDVDRFNLALEVRTALRPAPADAEVLREVPPVGIRRPSVPVIPGRTS